MSADVIIKPVMSREEMKRTKKLAKTFTREQVDKAVRAGAERIVNMVVRACHRKCPQASVMIDGKVVKWEDYLALVIFQNLDDPA